MMETQRLGVRELEGEDLQLTPEEAETQAHGLANRIVGAKQVLAHRNSFVDFGSPTLGLLLPQKGLKLTLSLLGVGDVPSPVAFRPASAGCLLSWPAEGLER